MLTLCTGSLDARDQWRHHPDNRSPAAWRSLRAEFDWVLALAESNDVLLGVEPELGNVVHSAEAAARLLGEVASPRIRIVFDAANLFEPDALHVQHRIIDHAIDLLGGSIALAHAKDRTWDGGFAAAGLGVLDWPHYLRALASSGYRGPLIAHGLSEVEAAATADFLSPILAAA